MRKSVCPIVMIAALCLASFTSGCKSGAGWSMPGSSLVGWGKKKPSTSSIAGTRSTPQPPSINVPPYPAGASNDSYASRAPSNGTYGADSYGRSSAPANNMYTGPYSMSGTNSTTGSTQNGFYSGATSSGPYAQTADSRSAGSYGGAGTTPNYPTTADYGRSPSTAYGGAPGGYATPNTTTGTPSYNGATPGFGAAPSYNSSAPTYGGSAYGGTSTGGSSYGTAPSAPTYSPPSSSYPTAPTYNPPSSSYPTNPSTSSSFPTTPPTGYGGGATSGYAAPSAGSYGSTPQYGAVPNTSTSPYGSTTYGSGGTMPTANEGSYSSTGGPYRPGSTNRNTAVLGGEQDVRPAGYSGSGGAYPTTTGSTGSSSYPGTYTK